MSEQLNVLKDIINLIKSTKGELDGVKTSIVEISKAARETQKSFDFKTPKTVSTQLQKNTQYTEQLTAAQKEQDRLEKALIRQIAKKDAVLESTNRALIKQRYETQQLNKLAKEEAVLTSKTSTNYQKLSVELNKMTREYKNLAAKKLRFGKLNEKEEKDLKRLEQQSRKTNDAIKKIDSAVGQNFRKVGDYGTALKGLTGGLRSLMGAFGITGGITLFSQLVKGAFENVKEFNSGLLDVSKTTGLAGSSLKELGEDIIKLSRNLQTVGTAKLLEYSTVAGQLGVKGSENILAFTEALAKLETASDISGEAGGADIARLLTLVDGGVENVADFGDEIVKLGNNFAATENEILKNATAIAQNTGIYKLARQQVLAYATATKAVGIESEITGSTIGKTLGLIEKSLRTGEGLQAVTELTGKSIGELQKLFKEDAGAVFTALIKGLNGVSNAGGSVNEKLEELGIKAVRDQRVIGSLASAGYGTLEQAMLDVTKAAGSLGQEFDTASTKMENQVSRLSVAWDNLVLSIESGDGVFSRYLLWWLDNAAGALDKLSLVLDGSTSLWEKAKLGVNQYTKTLSHISPFLTSGRGLFQDFADSVSKTTDELEKSTKAINSQNEAFVEQYGSLAPLTKAQQEYIDNQKEINILSGGFESSSSSGGKIDTLNEINEEIKNLKDELGDLNEADKKAIRTNIEQTKELEKRRDAILGVSNAQKDKNKALKDSITYFEDQISKLKNLRDETALTSDEYEDFTQKIEALEFQVSLLDGSYDDLLDSLSQPLPDISFEEAFSADKPESMFLPYIDLDEEELFENAQKVIDVQRELDAQLLDSKKEFYNNLKDLAFTAIDSIFEAESQRYDDRIDKNNEFYDNLLTNQELTEKQRSALEAEREKKNRELEKKKRDTERKAFLFGQAKALADIIIETTKTVAAIKLQASVLAANPVTAALAPVALAQIPFAIGSGAAAAAAVVATTIPQFREGHLEGTHEGIAMINDAPGTKFREIVERKDGSLQMYGGRNQLIGMEKGDKVHKAGTFTPNDIIRQSIAMTVIDQQQRLNQAQQEQILNVNISDQVGKMFSREFSKLAPHKPKEINYSKLAQAINLENRVRNR